MQEKYSGFDITTGVMTQGSIPSSTQGFQGVTINPAFLSKAENDEGTMKKLDEMLSGVETAEKWLKNTLSQNGLNLISSGFYIDENGNMSSWSLVEKKNSIFDGLKQQGEEAADRVKEKKKEKAEKKEDDKKAEEKQQEKKLSNDKVVIFAKSNEEMIRKAEEAIYGIEDKTKPKSEKAVGSNFDFSV